MRCAHINIRKATFILLSVLANNIPRTYMAGNDMNLQTKNQVVKNPNKNIAGDANSFLLGDVKLDCPMNENCTSLNYPCIVCDYPKPTNCTYGSESTVECRVKPQVTCTGEKKQSFRRNFICRFCYQTEPWEHTCDYKIETKPCNSVSSPRSYYKTNCTVNKNVLCLGNRTFLKNVPCNWTGGYRWSTALFLSITLGGFGADRFYLGHWQEGIGKLFSFGGLGVWTIIDVILISLHYLGPADGSLYI